MKDKILDIMVITILVALGIALWGFVVKMNLEEWPKIKEPPIYPEKPMVQENSLIGIAPPAIYRIKSLGCRVTTAYTSSEEETDDTPFITASGQETKKGIIATNELDFGTIVEIDGKTYEVQDRTNSRYKYLIDIWMETKEEALWFGRQIKEVNIIY